ncbi:hypothetical protein E2F48_16090 [Arthrobacter crusticola]|uniref:DUF1902 domain-containing protein n=1 Tax=Arthrobacter crusticola TaxID=2547960 RepID=A0A4R5TS30_9MICC|nr:hypothetical protein [Arthrobacter crusticola]TDK23510.1 hypothetical protein E2F48_16090 [Arthrobacter crusticola]
MELIARVWRAGDSWAVEVTEVPGLVTRARHVHEVVDVVATAYEQLTGALPEPFLVALEVDYGDAWLHRSPWPVRSKWKDMW